ncbi:MAG: YbaY family lipoprotein [Chthoniobacterales bacterium]
MTRLLLTLAIASALIGCATPPASTKNRTLRGTVTSPAGFTLPPSARLTLVLAPDPSVASDAPSLASKTIPISGKFPISFELPDPQSPDPTILLAQITVHGKTWFSNVLTPTRLIGNETGPIEVSVRRDGTFAR